MTVRGFGELYNPSQSNSLVGYAQKIMNQASKSFFGKLFTSLTALVFGLTGSFVSGVPASGSTLQVELVGDLNVGAGDGLSTSSSNKTEIFQDRLYFWGDDGTGAALWSYDGTNFAKPAVDSSLAAGEPGRPNVQSFAIFQDKLYFSGTVSSGAERELFVYDGTQVSLAYDFEDFLLPFNGSSNGNVDSLVATPQGLFLSANGHVDGQPQDYSRALWRWDGNSMHFVGKTNTAASNNTSRLTWIDGKLYFSADGPLGNSRPWVYDPTLPWSQGTLDSTTNPADLGIIGNQAAHFVTGFGSAGSKVYFGSEGFENGADIGKELWVFDPALPIHAETTPQTLPRNPSLVSDFRSGTANSDPADFVSAQGWLFFRLFPTSSIASIYAVDENGVVQNATGLQSYFQANNMTSFGHLRSFEDRLVFGSPFSNFGIYTYDRVQDVVTEVVPTRTSTGNFSALSLFQGKLYWAEASDAAVGRELYRFDSTAVFPQQAPQASVPAAYSGPIVESVNPNPAAAGAEITITGQRLSGVRAVSVDDLELSIIDTSATEITASLPLGVIPGLRDLVVSSDSGKLTVQDALEIIAAADKTPNFYTKVQADVSSVKIYAHNIVGLGKIQLFHNGREVAWTRVRNTEDFDGATPIVGEHSVYLVRTRDLVPGRNDFRIKSDGQWVTFSNGRTNVVYNLR